MKFGKTPAVTAAGNGAVMRCAPLAIRWMNDDGTLVRNSVVSAGVTHWDPRCIWSTVLVNLATASLLRDGAVEEAGLAERMNETVSARRGELAQLGIDLAAVAPSAVVEALSVAKGSSPDDVVNDGQGIGYTLKAMRVALWCAWRARDFEEALIAVVSAGGDTDTNGAIAGAVLGARFGLGTIPARWRHCVSALRSGRTAIEVWADRLLAVAA